MSRRLAEGLFRALSVFPLAILLPGGTEPGGEVLFRVFGGICGSEWPGSGHVETDLGDDGAGDHSGRSVISSPSVNGPWTGLRSSQPVERGRIVVSQLAEE